jgi:hypothetical protein
MNRRSVFNIFAFFLIVSLLFTPTRLQPRVLAAGTLLSVNFNSSTDGFTYTDDAFGTSQPAYASGTRTTSGGYGSTGGLQVSLGAVDATAITGMSGAWTYPLTLGTAESGVVLSFRYKLEQGAFYEFDEYSRVLVKLDSTQYGRGSKNYIDHIGGDGSSTQGNSNTYVVTTDWQQVNVYLGNLTAGNHTLTLGAYNNKKDASDEATTLVIDDVVVTSGNAVPSNPVQPLVIRSNISQFLAYNQGIAQFHDRCRGSGMGCSSTDYTTNYMAALAWVESQLQGMGYTTVRHNFNYSGNTGTNLWATKPGSVTPTQMYIISTHLDGRGGGDAFDDDGSGVALVLEIARVLSSPDVQTDVSVRFAFWDKEELGLYGANGYVQDRRSLQGTTSEPTWLGLIQHDMIEYDHGAGTRTTAQSAYADLDVEWRAGTAQETASKALALKWRFLNGDFSADYPANAYNYSTNTDDTPFQPYVAAISVRENRRSLTSGTNAEWINPNYHTVNDIEASYIRDDDGDGKRDDIELGFNAVQATLGTIATLAGAHITAANNPPTANPQSVTMAEDSALAVTLTGSDPNGDPLTFSVTVAPAHGALSGTAPNLTYTPAANYNGADSFQFVVNDGKVNSTAATVSITVTPVNDAPTANAQSVSATEDTPKAIILSGSDVEGALLSYSVLTQPSFGSLSGTAPNLTYTPALNYSGGDSFTFMVNDGSLNSAPAIVSITVAAVNDAPVASAQALETAEDTPVAITLSGSDIEGSPLSFSVTSSPLHGALAGAAPNLTYTPAGNFNGGDSFAFVANDGAVNSAPATVTLNVIAVNDAPVAQDQSVVTQQDIPVSITLSGSDVDGDALTFSVQSAPLHGVISGTAPDLVYTPETGYTGDDSFTFAASDGQVSSLPGTVSITVTRTNHQPAANGQSVATAEDTALAITLTGSDPDNDPLTYTVTAAPAYGALSGTSPNLTYTPSANYNGSDSIQFVVNDGLVDSIAATVVITIIAVNDAPVANAQSVSVDQGASVTITLTGSDVDGDALTYSVLNGPANGALSGTAPSLTYTPNAGFSGSDSFTFVAFDGQLGSAPATASITVNPAGPWLYLGSSTSGTADGVAYDDEDILLKNQGSGAWQLYFDGSDVGLSGTDVDAFELQPDGSLLMSFDSDFTLSGFGAVDDSDILRFVPTSTGANTAGAWQWYFDGSDVGLSTSDEDVDALTLLPDGRLIISVLGTVSVTGVSGVDEDLLAFSPTQLGSTTSGAWAMYFDGSDVGLSSTSNEDVNGVWIDAAGKIYLTTLGSFSVTGVSGDGSDIFTCTPGSLGSTTTCTFAMYWDGSDNGFSGEDTDSIGIIP